MNGNIKDIKNQRFGRLVVLELLSENPPKWKCQCDCGNTTNVQGTTLRYGTTKSCGCLRKEYNKRPKPYKQKRPYEYLYNNLTKSSKERSIICKLTYEEFLELVNIKNCFYCNNEIDWAPPFTPERGKATKNQFR